MMSELINVNNEYAEWISEVRRRFKSSQAKAATHVNTELLKFYWDLGKDLSIREKTGIYGTCFYENVSKDLMNKIPEIKSFSVTNLRYMRSFYELYCEEKNKSLTGKPIPPQLVGEFKGKQIVPQSVAQIEDTGILPQVVEVFKKEEITSEASQKVEAKAIHPQIVEEFKEQVIEPQAVAQLKEKEIFPQLGGKSIENEITQQFVAQIKYAGVLPQLAEESQDKTILPQAGEVSSNREIVPQVGGQSGKNVITPQLGAQLENKIFCIPWGHHRIIIDKCRGNQKKALFFVNKTLENNWSRAVLLNFLETDLYERNGKAITNFKEVLPELSGELAQEMTKDPYCFDFLTLREDYNEKELKEALLDNIQKFLLELGNGFTFAGKEYRLIIGKTEQYLDMLFYHVPNHCYVVIEVKISEFRPADMGQLGTYVTAVDDLLKGKNDNATVGLLICKTKDNILAKYAVKATNVPVGVSEYQLSSLVPEEYQGSMPTIEEIERELNGKSFNLK